MTVKRRDFQKIATTIHQFLLKLTDTHECAELRDSLNMSLLQLQKYYRRCQQRLQHTGRHNEQNGCGYVSPRQSLRITLSRTSETLSPMTPYIEEPQYFHVQWTVLDEKADQIRKSLSHDVMSPRRSINTPPMHYAATKADFEMLNDLFKEKKDVLEDQDILGRTPLMYAVYYNQIEVVRWLLKRGADPNSCDFNEVTSLHWACFKDNVALIELLIDAGANINCQDSFGRSASHWACTCSSPESLQLLIEFETSINLHDRNGLTPAMWASRLDHLSHLTLLLQVKNQNIDHIDGYERDRNGRTIIHWAIRKQQPLECFKFLLNEQTVQLKDDEGKSVLLLAAEQGALETCKIIIDKFGSKYIEDTDDNDRTSLILALSGGHGEVVNFLLENGAYLKSKDKTGATCMDIARNQYLFYCQLIISSHIREIEKKREMIPSDCVELIEKATSRQSSISDQRAIVKTPPRPPTSPKSPSSQASKSPILKRGLRKYAKEQSVENEEEMPNGFDAMSSDSLKIVYQDSEKNGKDYNSRSEHQNSQIEQPKLSKSLDHIQYQVSETLDYLDNDTGHQYHGSYEHLKTHGLDSGSKPENLVDSQITIEQNSQPRPFQRAKKFNKIKSNSGNRPNRSSSEIQTHKHETSEPPEDIQETYPPNKHNWLTHQSSTMEPPPKINYGASLEPINKHFSSEPVTRRKKKSSKDYRNSAQSQDRLKHLNVGRDKQLENLEPILQAKSLENVSNKSFQLPNGVNPKRLSSTAELMPHRGQSFGDRKSIHPNALDETRKNDFENNEIEKSSGRHIAPLDSRSPSWLKGGASRF